MSRLRSRREPNYCALPFTKGALLQHRTGMLVQQIGNVRLHAQSPSLRSWLKWRKAPLKGPIRQGIEAEKSGAKMPMKRVA